MRYLVIVSWMLLSPLSSAVAQVSIQIGVPNVSIGINVQAYPQLVRVPGYPVYYAPGVDSNYFFYDGMYWVFHDDTWYVSSWYNGPWALVGPQYVPVFILRVPVSYYRRPPPYFHGWGPSAPPRWGEHWGNDWERQHSGWDKWDHKSAPRPAPLPGYQKQYSGNRYPPPEQQPTLHGQKYRYQPQDTTVKQVYKAHGIQGGQPPPKKESKGEPPAKAPQHKDVQPSNQPAPHAEPGAPPPHTQPARAPEPDKGHQGKGQPDQGAKDKGQGSEQKGHSGQEKGGGHGGDK